MSSAANDTDRTFNDESFFDSQLLKDRKSENQTNVGQEIKSANNADNAGENKNDKKGEKQDWDTRLST